MSERIAENGKTCRRDQRTETISFRDESVCFVVVSFIAMRENEECSQPRRVGAFAGADQRQQRVRLPQAAPCAFVSVAFALDEGCSSCERARTRSLPRISSIS